MNGSGAGAAPPPPTRRREEANVPPALQGLVSGALRVGVGLAAVLLLVGLLWAFASGGMTPLASTGGANLVGGALAHPGPSTVLLAGVLVLILTPVSRVVISLSLFASVRDLAFVGLTATVLVLLAASIYVGFHP